MDLQRYGVRLQTIPVFAVVFSTEAVTLSVLKTDAKLLVGTEQKNICISVFWLYRIYRYLSVSILQELLFFALFYNGLQFCMVF